MSDEIMGPDGFPLKNCSIERLRRKRDQAWECAGCARVDGDKMDEQRWTMEAIAWQNLITDLYH